MTDLNGVLSSNPLFNFVESPTNILKQLNVPAPLKYKKNDVIYDTANFNRSIGIVIKGQIQVSSYAGKELLLNNLGPGQLFGAAAVFSNSESYVSNITSKTDSEILFLREDTLIELFNRYPQISINYIKILSEKIRFLNYKLALFNEDSIDSRLYLWLQNNVDKYGHLPSSISKSKIANILGIGRTSLYRSFESLEAKGLIIRNENIIEVVLK